MNVERLFRAAPESPPFRARQAGPSHFRREDRAGVDFDDAMRPRLHEADMGIAALVVAGVEGRAAAPAPQASTSGATDRPPASMPGIAQGVDDQAALPVLHRRLAQRLHGAAAAIGEMRTGGRIAVRRRLTDLHQLAAFAVDLGENVFARQSVRA